MKLPLLFPALLLSVNLFGQTEVKLDRRDIGVNEQFFVKADSSVKSGPYAAYSYYGGKLICEGFYKNNVKDSIWTSFDSKGNLEIKYDYTHKNLLVFNPTKYMGETKKYDVIKGTDTLNTILDRPPILIDGEGKIFQLFWSNLKYPIEAKENDTQGKVLVAFTIDTLGNTSNFRTKNRVGAGCDEEALRVVKLIEGDWLPGIINGKPVTVEYIIPVNFTLTTSK